MGASDQEFRKVVGRNVRRLRLRRNWTQEALKTAMGWKHQSMVSQIENGKVGVSRKMIKKLCNVFSVNDSDLIREVEDEVIPDTVRLRTVLRRDADGSKKAHAGVPDTYLRKRKVFRLSALLEALSGSPPGPRIYLPDWLPGRKVSDLFCVIVDHPFRAPDFNRGDIVCIDKDADMFEEPVEAEEGADTDIDLDEEKVGIPGFYALKESSGPVIQWCVPEVATIERKEVDTLRVYSKKTDKEPHYVLNLDKQWRDVIGRVAWCFRYM